GTWPIYRLTAPPKALRQMPRGEIRNPFRVNFGGQIELLGVSSRTLTELPTAFELLYFWQSLTEPAMDLRPFVYVADPAGEIVYHANLKSPAGYHPSAR